MQPNGYFGQCHTLNLSASEVVQRTWYITSRIAKPECQEQIMEVFCAMQYDLNGQCVPSRFFNVDNDNSGLGGWTQHIYPLRGQRPQNLWEELYLWRLRNKGLSKRKKERKSLYVLHMIFVMGK